MTDKRFVVLSFSVGTASLLAALCGALLLAVVLNQQPQSHKPAIDVPRLPHGDLSNKEANDIKYGPVNFSAAKEVKQGIISRLRARRATSRPAAVSNCAPVTYAQPVASQQSIVPHVPGSYLPQPAPVVDPRPVCPDGNCNPGYLPPSSATLDPSPAPYVGSLPDPVEPLESMPPDDSAQMQLLVVGHSNQAPVTWFDTDATLRRVKQSVAFTRIDPGSVMHRERYSQLGNETPIVSLSWGDGRSIYIADRNTLPQSPSQLFSEMKTAVTAARAAKPALDSYFSSTSLALSNTSLTPPSSPDCPDGNCPVPPSDGFRFPRLRPPADDASNPLFQAVEGFLKDSFTSGLWLVFSIVALGFVLVFAVLILGAIILVVRSLT